MTSTLTPSVLRPLLEELRRTRPDEQLIGVQLPGTWSGNDSVHFGGEARPLRVCHSPIDVRAAAVEQEALGQPLVVLTPLTDRDLGLDITSRLAGQQLLRPSLARAVMQLFEAHDLDRRIAREDWLLRALVENLPPDGYQPVPSGSLTSDRAWEELLRTTLDLPVSTPTLAELLQWSRQEDHRLRLQDADPDLREGFSARLAHLPGAELLLAIAEHARDTEDTMAVIGVLSILVARPQEPAVLLAAGRIAERHLGGIDLDLTGSATALVTTAMILAREQHRAGNSTLSWTRRATELCEGLDLGAYIEASDLLDEAWSARLTRFAQVLMNGLSTADCSADVLHEAHEALCRHVRAPGEDSGEVLDAADAMTRLARWLSVPPSAPASTLSASIADEIRDGGWVVWARAQIGSIPAAELTDAARQLARAVDDRRSASAVAFAAAAVRWDGAPAEDLLGVEHVLDRIVAPTAIAAPTLVVVLDGMSLAVLRELLYDLDRQGWIERRPSSAIARPAALAVLPSLTTLSRATLLSGRLTSGGQAVEVAGFAEHAGLQQAGTSGGPPLLFHKRALSDDGTTLATTVRDEIFGSRRIVGLVLNAIDDELGGAVQRRGRWALRDIPLLDAALSAARNAERAVVLLSDHGHVPERAGTHRVAIAGGSSGSGDRHRPVDSGAVSSGEVLAEGGRVLAAGGRSVLAADPSIRYTAASKPGYHGGASPEELVAPISVLTAFDHPLDGLIEQEPDEPSWWRPEVPSTPELVAAPAIAQRSRRRTPAGRPDQPTLEGLFVEPAPKTPTPPPPSWIGALLTHPAFQQARERAGRGALADDRARALLVALARHDGRLSAAALAAAAEVPRSRLDGALSALRPLLNVDGYPILTVDPSAELVELRIGDLRRQFGI